MNKNRIPRRNFTERTRVLARIRQQMAEATYYDNIAATEPLVSNPVVCANRVQWTGCGSRL